MLNATTGTCSIGQLPLDAGTPNNRRFGGLPSGNLRGAVLQRRQPERTDGPIDLDLAAGYDFVEQRPGATIRVRKFYKLQPEYRGAGCVWQHFTAGTSTLQCPGGPRFLYQGQYIAK